MLCVPASKWKSYWRKCVLSSLLNHGEEALLDILHNTQFGGLPRDPKQLYKEIKTREQVLRTVKVIRKDQWLKLLPPKRQETFSKQFDITLLANLIINCCTQLPKPLNGTWDPANLRQNDQSVSANVLRIRTLRNKIVHNGAVLSGVEFSKLKNETKHVILGLGYRKPFHDLSPGLAGMS